MTELEEEQKRKIAEHYTRSAGFTPIDDFRKKEVEYLAIEPPKVELKISLVEFFERIKLHRADDWQRDFCNRLQEGFLNRSTSAIRALVHAQAQLGKSVILAQCYPAWILGHDPMHRVALATYNVSRSQSHSKAVIAIMNQPVYREIFTDEGSYVKKSTSKERWQTPARAASTEAQDSFNPVGLQSGLTGSGFDTLVIDDPYADQKEAFSDTVRQTLQDFWEYTVVSRMSPYANVFGMFHRYHVQDLAGYLLDKGEFDYWRYATECDGPYIHSETGQKFDDPLNRQIGELISPKRFPHSYYSDKRSEKSVWNSMFQGKPTSDEGDFFAVGKIKLITDSAIAATRRQEAVGIARSYDNAASDDEGDHTCGIKGSIRSDGLITLYDMVLEQVGTERRMDLMKATALEDGRDVGITVPQDPSSAGKDVVFFTQQELKDYSVHVRPTSSNKKERARNAANAVSDGLVEIVEGDWNKKFLKALREFPYSTFDDPVDAFGDLYNHLYEIIRRGLVIKNYQSINNLLDWSVFAAKFPVAGQPCSKIPKNFTIYAGVKITADASLPNSAVIVARAPDNARMGEKLFVVAEYKEWTADYFRLFDWLDRALDVYCSSRDLTTVWLHPDSEEYRNVLWQKLDRPVAVFQEDAIAGLTELDFYLRSNDGVNPFVAERPDVGLHCLIHDEEQFAVPKDEYGLASLRQELQTWNYSDKGEQRKPSAIGAVADCLRMITYCFRTIAVELTKEERVEEAMPDRLKAETLAEMPISEDKDALLTRRAMELKKVNQQVNKPVRSAASTRFARR